MPCAPNGLAVQLEKRRLVRWATAVAGVFLVKAGYTSNIPGNFRATGAEVVVMKDKGLLGEYLKPIFGWLSPGFKFGAFNPDLLAGIKMT